MEIDGLPLHVYEAEGEEQVKPCAEMLLTERDVEWILDQGYMALASIRGRDAARLVRFQSIAKPAARLSGRWVSSILTFTGYPARSRRLRQSAEASRKSYR